MNPDSAWFPCVDTFEEDPAVIYTLDRELRITYCNKAWDRFAEENAGTGLRRHTQIGRPWLDCIPEPLLAFYRSAVLGVLCTGTEWEHRYECSSPDLYRCFHMRVLPLEPVGLVVINSKVQEQPHPCPGGAAVAARELYADSKGVIKMCANCRRTLRPESSNVWDWVPGFVAHPPLPVSHGVCGPCLTYYYNLAPSLAR